MTLKYSFRYGGLKFFFWNIINLTLELEIQRIIFYEI